MANIVAKSPSFTRRTYLATYNPRQRWMWPTYMIRYIIGNPSSVEVYQKLAQTCKYFFIKNPILNVEKLYFDNNCKPWGTYCHEIRLGINLNNVKTKIWITDKVENNNDNIPLNMEPPNIPDFYRIDAKTLLFKNQIIFNEKFLRVFANAENVTLFRSVIRKEDGAIVPLEKLVEITPKAKYVLLNDNPSSSSITTNTVQELLQIPHFFNLDKLELCYLPETFDIETFFTQAIKNNTHTKFCLQFDDISEAFKARLDAIIDEIISAEDHNYKLPMIDYFLLPDPAAQNYRIYVKNLLIKLLLLMLNKSILYIHLLLIFYMYCIINKPMSSSLF